MADQKVDNLLNLAMDATPQERRKSENLNVGYDSATRLWDVIVKYSGPESGLAGNGIQVVPLLGGYAAGTEYTKEENNASNPAYQSVKSCVRYLCRASARLLIPSLSFALC